MIIIQPELIDVEQPPRIVDLEPPVEEAKAQQDNIIVVPADQNQIMPEIIDEIIQEENKEQEARGDGAV